jgi:lysophospholipase L1-like esterase
MPGTSPSEAPRRYVALGDSFTAGMPDSGEESFADRLAHLLRRANPALRYWNLAVSGARTPEVADGQLDAALALRPDAVTVVSGGNDALLSLRPDVAAHAAGIDRALATLRKALPHARVVTATVPDPARFLALRPRSAARVTGAIEAINRATRASASRHGAALIDLAAHPEAGARVNYAGDGYHPSADASRLAAEAFAQLFGIPSPAQEAHS